MTGTVKENGKALLPLVQSTQTLRNREQDPENHLLQKELWKKFDQVIAIFPWKQKHALLMFYAHQLSYEEIAEVLDIKLSDVKSAIYRGRQKLRVSWRGEEHEQGT